MSPDNLSDPQVQAVLARLKVIAGIPFYEIGKIAGLWSVLVPLAAVVRPEPRGEGRDRLTRRRRGS